MSSSQSPVKPMLAPSERLLNVPPYALAKVFQARDEKVREGVDVIDLGVGNPDLRPPQRAVETLEAALNDPEVQNHRYPSFNGLPEFRAGIARWYHGRFGVRVDTDADSYRWLFAGERGVGSDELLVLLAPETPGTYTVYVAVGRFADRAEVVVTAPDAQ